MRTKRERYRKIFMFVYGVVIDHIGGCKGCNSCRVDGAAWATKALEDMSDKLQQLEEEGE